MKKRFYFFAISFFILFLFSVLQAQTKKITILEPFGTVSPIRKAIVSAILSETLTNTGSFEVVARTDAELICITQFTNEEDYFFVESRLVELESEKTVATTNQRIAIVPITEFEKGCIQLAVKLAWWSTIGASPNKSDMISRRNGEIYNPDGLELIYVEGIDSGVMANNGFFIGKFEITQAQWKAIMGNNLSNFTGDSLPVENVSWYDVKEFLRRLNAVTGRNYRLPTEAEWNFAANGGTLGKGYVYSGSDNIDIVAWYKENSGKRITKRKYAQGKRYKYDDLSDQCTHSVGAKQPNELGIYDMTGNVWEWCEDWCNRSQQQRVVKGGGWDSNAKSCRISNRICSAPGNRDRHLGFRVALSF